MFQFKLFGMDAVFNEEENTLSYGGETRYFSEKYNEDDVKTAYFKFNNKCNLKCSYCFQKGEDHGTFSEKYVDLLQKHSERIEMLTITLDGNPDVQDKRRVYLDGRGTFSVVLNRLKLLCDARIPFTIQINIDKENLHTIEELIYILRRELKKTGQWVLC